MYTKYRREQEIVNKPLKLKAYAKVNLGLDVIRRREDGYHDVRMIMQTINLYDMITMRKNTTGDIRLTTNLPYLPTNENNLVYKAIDRIRTEYNIEEGITVDINKHIPVAAGMAGGSSDAAAAFVGMNQLFELGITQQQLMDYAVDYGADIPYCIMRGTAVSEGIGEILTPLPPMPDCWIVVVKPTFSMSTKYVYQNLVLDENTAHPDIDGMIDAIKNQDLSGIVVRMGNVLEQVTTTKYTDIPKIKQILINAGALGALMSGSGPTVFGIFDNKESAMRIAKKLMTMPKIKQTAVVQPINRPGRKPKNMTDHVKKHVNHHTRKGTDYGSFSRTK